MAFDGLPMCVLCREPHHFYLEVKSKIGSVYEVSLSLKTSNPHDLGSIYFNVEMFVVGS